MSDIAIIVPVYKVEAFIRRCVDSILSQSYRNFTLILVDDGSPDQSGTICDEYAEKDQRIHVIHQSNMGLSGARNTGIDFVLSQNLSKWIAFIDSDDWIHEKYLEAMIRCADQFDADVAITNFEKTDGYTPQVDTEKLDGTIVDVDDFYINYNVVATTAWGKLYKSKLFNEIRYPIGKLHEDEFTTYKILFNVNTIVFIDQPMYYYYQNPEGIMNSAWNPRRMDAFEALEEHIVYFQNKPAVRDAQIRRYLNRMNRTINTMGDSADLIPYKKQLKKRLKLLLIKYRKNVPWKDIPYIAEKAFPHYMSCYWVIKAQINKVTRLFRH